MQPKKTPGADLQNRRVLFIEIGLVAALAVVVGVFSWGRPEKRVEKIDLQIRPVEQEIIYVTRRYEEPPKVKPQPAHVLSDFINVVKNEAEIIPDYGPEDSIDDFVFEIPDGFFEEEEEEEAPVFVAEEMPSFQGGDLGTFRNWVYGQLVYPPAAVAKIVQGEVTLKWVIEKDGTLTNIEETGSADRLLSGEAIRVLKLSPRWTPGMHHGKPVRVCYIMPIEFVLQN